MNFKHCRLACSLVSVFVLIAFLSLSYVCKSLTFDPTELDSIVVDLVVELIVVEVVVDVFTVEEL